MNKSFFALIFTLPLLAACFGKKSENNETVKTELVQDIAPAAQDDETECNDEIAEHEHDEK